MRPHEDVGLWACNSSAFYFRFALPLVRRHELIKATLGAVAFEAERAAEYDYLAIRALAAYNNEWGSKNSAYLLAQHVAMPALAEYLRAHYATGYDPQDRPLGGDRCRQVVPWRWGSFAIKPESLGVLSGSAGYASPDAKHEGAPDGGSITFNLYAGAGFLGNHGPTSIGPEYCSCSGGPATIWTDYGPAKFSGEFNVAPFWRWKDRPQADGGETFTQVRPIWLFDLNRDD